MEGIYRELHDNLSYLKNVALNANAATRGNEVQILKAIDRRLQDHFGALAQDLKTYAPGTIGGFYSNLLDGTGLSSGEAEEEGDGDAADEAPNNTEDIAAGDDGAVTSTLEDEGAVHRSEQVTSLLGERVALLALVDMILDSPPQQRAPSSAVAEGTIPTRDPTASSSEGSGEDDENAGLLPHEKGVRRKRSKGGGTRVTTQELFSKLYGGSVTSSSQASSKISITEFLSFTCQQLCSQTTSDTAGAKAALEAVLSILRLCTPHMAAVHCEGLAHAAAIASESTVGLWEDQSQAHEAMPELVQRMGTVGKSNHYRQEDLPPVNKDMLLVICDLVINNLNAFHCQKKHETLQTLCVEILIVLVTNCSFIITADELQVPTTLVKLLLFPIVNQERGAGQTLKGSILSLLGLLCQQYPLAMVGVSQEVWGCFVSTMRALTTKATPEMTLGKGLLGGLCGYMGNFSISVADTLWNNSNTPQHPQSSSIAGNKRGSATAQLAELKLLYGYLRSTLGLASQDTTHRYHMVYAALGFLGEHGLLLKEFLLEDAVGMFDTLMSVCGHKNVTLHKKAYPTANAVLQIISLEMCEGENSNGGTNDSQRQRSTHCANILSKLLERCYALLKSSVKYELSFAVSACGCLARPVRLYGSGPSAQTGAGSTLQQLLGVLIGKCEGMLSRTQDDLEEAARHFPQFLTSIANLLLEMDSGTLQAATAQSIAALLDAVLLLYPKAYYFPKMRAYTAPSILKLLLAIRLRHAAFSPEANAIQTNFLKTALTYTSGSSAMFKDGREVLMKRWRREERHNQYQQRISQNKSHDATPAASSKDAKKDADNLSYQSWGLPVGSQLPHHADDAAVINSQPYAPVDDGDVEGALYEEYLPLWSRLLLAPRRQKGGMLRQWGYPWTTVCGVSSFPSSGTGTSQSPSTSGSMASLRSAAMSNLPTDASGAEIADRIVLQFVSSLQEGLLGCVLDYLQGANLGCESIRDDGGTNNNDHTQPSTSYHRSSNISSNIPGGSIASYASGASSIITSLSMSSNQHTSSRLAASGSQSSAATLWLDGGANYNTRTSGRSRLVARERLLSGVTAAATATAHHARFTAEDGVIAPSNPIDYSLFLNMVSFIQKGYTMVLRGVSNRWVGMLLKCVVEKAAILPHVSGLYSIAECLLKVLQQRTVWGYEACSTNQRSGVSKGTSLASLSSSHRRKEKNTIQGILGRAGMFALWTFLQRTARRLPDFSDELLVAAAKCVIATPKSLVISIAANGSSSGDRNAFIQKACTAASDLLSAPIRTLVEMGSTCPDAGEASLAALEYWLSSTVPLAAHNDAATASSTAPDASLLVAERIQTDLTSIVLRRVHLYLGGHGSGHGVSATLDEVAGETLLEKRERRRREQFTDRLARLIGQEGLRLAVSLGESLSDTNATSATSTSDSSSSTSTFEFVDYYGIMELELQLARDVRTVMPLHRILPRVIHLARQDPTLSDADRRPRVASAEFLHATVLLLVGRGMAACSSTTVDIAKKEAYGDLFRQLIPHVVFLSASTDVMVHELFHSLLMQLAHWCGSGGSEQIFLVDSFIAAVFDAIFLPPTDESTSSSTSDSGGSQQQQSSGGGANRAAAMRSTCLTALSEFHAYCNNALPVMYTPESGRSPHMEALQSLYRRLSFFLSAKSVSSSSNTTSGTLSQSPTSNPHQIHWLGALVFNRLYHYFLLVVTIVENHAEGFLKTAINAMEEISTSSKNIKNNKDGGGGGSSSTSETSLEQQEATREQLDIMIGNLEQVLMVHADRFLSPSPTDPNKSVLEVLVIWLFRKLLGASTAARPLLMRLYFTLCSCLPGFKEEDGPLRFTRSLSSEVNNVGSISGCDAFIKWAKDTTPTTTTSNNNSTTNSVRPDGFNVGHFIQWTNGIESSMELTLWLIRCGFLNANAFGTRNTTTSVLPKAILKGATPEMMSSGKYPPDVIAAPKIKLLPHMWALVCLLSDGDIFQQDVLGGLDDEQALAVVTSTLGALEAIVALVGDLQSKHVSTLWCTCDPTIQLLHPHQRVSNNSTNTTASPHLDDGSRRALQRLYPILSKELYTLAAKLLISPNAVFGEAAVGDAILGGRIRECGITLTTAAWEGARAVSIPGRDELGVAAMCMGAVVRRPPHQVAFSQKQGHWWLSSSSNVQDVLLEDAHRVYSYVRGLRSLLAHGPTLARLLENTADSTDGTALLKVVKDLVSAATPATSYSVRPTVSQAASTTISTVHAISTLSIENAQDPVRVRSLREICSLALDQAAVDPRHVSSQLMRMLLGFSDPILAPTPTSSHAAEVDNKDDEDAFLLMSRPELDPNVETLPPDELGYASSDLLAPLLFVPSTTLSASNNNNNIVPTSGGGLVAPSQGYLLGAVDATSLRPTTTNRGAGHLPLVSQAPSTQHHQSNNATTSIPLLSRGSLWMKLFSKDILHYCTKHASHFMPTISNLLGDNSHDTVSQSVTTTPSSGKKEGGDTILQLVQRDIAQQLLVGMCERLSMSYTDYYRNHTSSYGPGEVAVDPLTALVSQWDRCFGTTDMSVSGGQTPNGPTISSQIALRLRLAKMLFPLSPALVGAKLSRTCIIDVAYALGISHTLPPASTTTTSNLFQADVPAATSSLRDLISTLSHTPPPSSGVDRGISQSVRFLTSMRDASQLPPCWTRRHLLSCRASLVNIKGTISVLKYLHVGSDPSASSTAHMTASKELLGYQTVCAETAQLVVAMMGHFIADALLNEIPVSPEEELKGGSDQQSVYHDLIKIVLQMLRHAPSPIPHAPSTSSSASASSKKKSHHLHGAVEMMFELLPLVRQQSSSAPLFGALNRTLATSVKSMQNESALFCVDECFSRLSGSLPADIRQAVCYRILIPALRAIRGRGRRERGGNNGYALLTTIATKYIGQLVILADGTAPVCAAFGPSLATPSPFDSLTPMPFDKKDDAADGPLRNVATIRACAYSILETLYTLLQTETLKGPVNIAYTHSLISTTATATSAPPLPKGTELTGKLVRACQESMKAICDGDAKERTTTMDVLDADPTTDAVLSFRQAAYSCLVAVLLATQTKEDTFIKMALGDNPSGDQWRGLVDRRVHHHLSPITSYPQIPMWRLLHFTDWEVQNGVVGSVDAVTGEGNTAGASPISTLRRSGLSRMSQAVSGYLSNSSIAKLMPAMRQQQQSHKDDDDDDSDSSSDDDMPIDTTTNDDSNPGGDGSVSSVGRRSHPFAPSQSQPLFDDPIMAEHQLMAWNQIPPYVTSTPQHQNNDQGPSSLTPTSSAGYLTPAGGRPPSPTPQTPSRQASGTQRTSPSNTRYNHHSTPNRPGARIYDIAAALSHKAHALAEANLHMGSQRMVMQRKEETSMKSNVPSSATAHNNRNTANTNMVPDSVLQSHGLRLEGEDEEDALSFAHTHHQTNNQTSTNNTQHSVKSVLSSIPIDPASLSKLAIRESLVDVDGVYASGPFGALLRLVNFLIQRFPTGVWAQKLLQSVFIVTVSGGGIKLVTPDYSQHANIRLVFCKLFLLRADFFFSTNGPLSALGSVPVESVSSTAEWRFRECLFGEVAIHCLGVLVSPPPALVLGKGVHYMIRDLCTAMLHAGLGLAPSDSSGTAHHHGLLLHSGFPTGSPFLEGLQKGTITPLTTSLAPHVSPLSTALTSFLVRNLSDASNAVMKENLHLIRELLSVGKRASSANNGGGGNGIYVSKAELLGWLTYDANKTIPELPVSLQNDAAATKARHAEVVSKTRMGRMCGVQLCGVIASLGIPLFIPRVDSKVVKEEVFYSLLLQNLSIKGPGASYAALNNATAEVVGMALAALWEKSTTVNDLSLVLQQVTKAALHRIFDMSKADGRNYAGQTSPLVGALRRIAEHFPGIVDRFLHPVGAIFSLGSGATTFSDMVVSDQVRILELVGMWLESQGVTGAPAASAAGGGSTENRHSGGGVSDSHNDTSSQVSGAYGLNSTGAEIGSVTPADDLYPSLQTQFSFSLGPSQSKFSGGNNNNTTTRQHQHAYTGDGVDAAVETALFRLLGLLVPTLSTHYIDSLMDWFIMGMKGRIQQAGGGTSSMPIADTRVAFYQLCIVVFNTLSARGGESAKKLAEEQQKEQFLSSFFGGQTSEYHQSASLAGAGATGTHRAEADVYDIATVSEVSEGDRVASKHLPQLLSTLQFGLSDTAPYVQDIILTFWNDPSRMPSETALARLFAIYHQLLPRQRSGEGNDSGRIKDNFWLHHASILMLYLSHQSLDFTVSGKLVQIPLSTSAAFFPVTLDASCGASMTSSRRGELRPMFALQQPVRQLEKVPASLGGYAPKRFELGGGTTQGNVVFVGEGEDTDSNVSVSHILSGRQSIPATQYGGGRGVVVPSIILNAAGGQGSVASVSTQGHRWAPSTSHSTVPGRLLAFGGPHYQSGGGGAASFSSFDSVLSRRQYQPYTSSRGTRRFRALGGASQQDVAGGYGGYTSSLLFTPGEPSRVQAPTNTNVSGGTNLDDSVSQRGGAMSSSSVQSQTANIRRRFRNVGLQHQTRQHILHASRISEEARVAVELDRQRKRHSVMIFRQYRAGEVPDVQSVTQQSLVVPLQAMCLYDSELSLIVSTILSEAVFGAVHASVRSGLSQGLFIQSVSDTINLNTPSVQNRPTVTVATSSTAPTAPTGTLFQTSLAATVGGATAATPQVLARMIHLLRDAMFAVSKTTMSSNCSATTSHQEKELTLMRRVSSATSNTLLASSAARPSGFNSTNTAVMLAQRSLFLRYIQDMMLSNLGIAVEILPRPTTISHSNNNSAGSDTSSPNNNDTSRTTHITNQLLLENTPLPSEISVFDAFFNNNHNGHTDGGLLESGGLYLLESMAALRIKMTHINKRLQTSNNTPSASSSRSPYYHGWNLLFKALRSSSSSSGSGGYGPFGVGPQILPSRIQTTILEEWPHMDRIVLNQSTEALYKSIASMKHGTTTTSAASVPLVPPSEATSAVCDYAEEFIKQEAQVALCRMLRWDDACDLPNITHQQQLPCLSTSALPFLLALGFSKQDQAPTRTHGTKSSRDDSTVSKPLEEKSMRPTLGACILFLRAHARSLISGLSAAPNAPPSRHNQTTAAPTTPHDAIITSLLVAAGVLPTSQLAPLCKDGSVLTVLGDPTTSILLSPPTAISEATFAALDGLAIEIAQVLFAKRRVTACAEWCQARMSALLLASTSRGPNATTTEFVKQLQQLSCLTVLYDSCKYFLSLQRTKQASKRARNRNLALQRQQQQLHFTSLGGGDSGAGSPFRLRNSGRLAGPSALLGGRSVAGSFLTAGSGMRSETSSNSLFSGGAGGTSSVATLMSLYDTMDAAAANPLADAPSVFSGRIVAMMRRWAAPLLRAALDAGEQGRGNNTNTFHVGASAILTDPLVWNELISTTASIAQTCEIALSVGHRVGTFSDAAVKCKEDVLQLNRRLQLGAVQCLSRRPYAVPAAGVLIIPLVKETPRPISVTAAVHSLTLSQRRLHLNLLASQPLNIRGVARTTDAIFNQLNSQLSVLDRAQDVLGSRFVLQSKTAAQHLFVQAANLLDLSRCADEAFNKQYNECTAASMAGFQQLLEDRPPTTTTTVATTIPSAMFIGGEETARTYLQYLHSMIVHDESITTPDTTGTTRGIEYWPHRRTFVYLALKMLSGEGSRSDHTTTPATASQQQQRKENNPIDLLERITFEFSRTNYDLARQLFPKVLEIIAIASNTKKEVGDLDTVAIYGHFCGSTSSTSAPIKTGSNSILLRISTVAVLPWCAQIISYLSASRAAGPVVWPLVQALAQAHPYQVVYPYLTARDALLERAESEEGGSITGAVRGRDGGATFLSSVLSTLDDLLSKAPSMQRALMFRQGVDNLALYPAANSVKELLRDVSFTLQKLMTFDHTLGLDAKSKTALEGRQLAPLLSDQAVSPPKRIIRESLTIVARDAYEKFIDRVLLGNNCLSSKLLPQDDMREGGHIRLATAQIIRNEVGKRLQIACPAPLVVPSTNRQGQALHEAQLEEFKDAILLKTIGRKARRHDNSNESESVSSRLVPYVLEYQKLSNLSEFITKSKLDISGEQQLSGISTLLSNVHNKGADDVGAAGSAQLPVPVQPSVFFTTHPALIPSITQVGPRALVLSSIQRPIRISIFTSSERQQLLLVKGNDDLRTDERVQFIYWFVNSVLSKSKSSSGTRHRAMELRGYSVVPMSTSTGVIEWLPMTEPLADYINRGVKAVTVGRAFTESLIGGVGELLGAQGTDADAQRRLLSGKLPPPGLGVQNLKDQVASLQEVPAPVRRGLMDRGQVALLNHSATKGLPHLDGGGAASGIYSNPVTHATRKALEYTATVAEYSTDYLRAAYDTYLAHSRADYFVVRERFANSVGLMSMINYLLGVGDRHLKNHLVDLRTGDFIAIDFGMLFGTGVSLPVAELVPFRLTPQMVQVLGVFGTRLLEGPMITTLKAIRNEEGPFKTMLSSFLREPLSAWQSTEKKSRNKDMAAVIGTTTSAGEDEDDTPIGSTTAEEKLSVVFQKLQLKDPCAVISSQLSKNMFVLKLASEKKTAPQAVFDVFRNGFSGGLSTNTASTPSSGCPPPRALKYAKEGTSVAAVEAFVASEAGTVRLLLDMATDPELLSRMYGGWSPGS